MVHVADALMIELCNKLPPPNTHWPIEERMRWLRACEAIFDMLYGQSEKIDIDAFLPKTASHDDLDAHAAAMAPSGSYALVDNGDETASEIFIPDNVVVTKPAPGENYPVTVGNGGARGPQEGEPPEPRAPYSASSLKNVGGRPSKTRPEGLPSNLSMAIEALTALGPASAPQIRDWLRKKHWGGMPDYWTAILWDFAKRGSLGRDGTNFTVPKHGGVAKDVVTSESTPRQVVNPDAKLGPPARQEGVLFVFHGRPVSLRAREFKIAEHLRSAMGKGHLDARFLGDQVGIRSDAEAMLRDLVSIMNPKLENVGVEIKFFKGFGFIMQELA